MESLSLFKVFLFFKHHPFLEWVGTGKPRFEEVPVVRGVGGINALNPPQGVKGLRDFENIRRI